ncbi:MAG: TraB/GumN family protein [Panacagrimonas sp.]
MPGIPSGLGIDQHFFRRAAAQNWPVQSLESPQAQLDLLEGMDAPMAGRFLQSSLDDLERPELRPDALVQLWLSNDVPAMARLVEETAAGFPRFNARLLDDRNATRMALLVRRPQSDTDQLVIVGARLAAVVMGGIVTFSLLMPLVLPGLYRMLARQDTPPAAGPGPDLRAGALEKPRCRRLTPR